MEVPIKLIRLAACLAISLAVAGGTPEASVAVPAPVAHTPGPELPALDELGARVQGAPVAVEATEAPSAAGALPGTGAPPVEPEPVEPPRAQAVPRALEPGGAAVASYFGPGLFGRRTACGLVLTMELVGVAHRTLPCGSTVTLRYGPNVLSVPVVDRGPYVYSREFDLTYATKLALGCPDLCNVTWLR